MTSLCHAGGARRAVSTSLLSAVGRLVTIDDFKDDRLIYAVRAASGGVYTCHSTYITNVLKRSELSLFWNMVIQIYITRLMLAKQITNLSATNMENGINDESDEAKRKVIRIGSIFYRDIYKIYKSNLPGETLQQVDFAKEMKDDSDTNISALAENIKELMNKKFNKGDHEDVPQEIILQVNRLNLEYTTFLDGLSKRIALKSLPKGAEFIESILKDKDEYTREFKKKDVVDLCTGTMNAAYFLKPFD